VTPATLGRVWYLVRPWSALVFPFGVPEGSRNVVAVARAFFCRKRTVSGSLRWRLSLTSGRKGSCTLEAGRYRESRKHKRLASGYHSDSACFGCSRTDRNTQLQRQYKDSPTLKPAIVKYDYARSNREDKCVRERWELRCDVLMLLREILEDHTGTSRDLLKWIRRSQSPSSF
jgi:hypothetical protein